MNLTHIYRVTTTGVYISTNNGYGANYKMEGGRYFFCSPTVNFKERLGRVLYEDTRFTQEERLAYLE